MAHAAFAAAHSALFFRRAKTCATPGSCCDCCGRLRTKTRASCDFASKRERMVQQQLMARGIHEERVLAAMAKVPREEFVPPNSRAESYEDGPLQIGYRQTISQPYIVAFMTEQLQPKRNDRVLEVGAGSGYQAAILAELVAEVYTIKSSSHLRKAPRRHSSVSATKMFTSKRATAIKAGQSMRPSMRSL